MKQPKILLEQPNVLLLLQNILVVPILTNDFVGVTKPFTPCDLLLLNYLKVSRVSETTDF